MSHTRGILLLTLLLFITSAFGEDTRFSKRLKITSYLYQTNLQTQAYLIGKIQGMTIKSINDQDYNSDVDALLDEVISDRFKKDLALRVKLKNSVISILKEVRAIGREDGVGLAIFFSASEIIQFLCPVIFGSLGMPILILPAEIAFSELNVPAIYGIQKLFHRRKRIKEYGGRDSYKKVIAARDYVEDNYGLTHNSIMFPDEGANYFTINAKGGLIRRCLSAFGLIKSMDPIHLKRAFRKEGVWNEELKKIKRSKLDTATKSALMVSYALKKIPTGHDILLKHFDKFHFEGMPVTASPEIIDWSMDFDDTFDIDELKAWLLKAPTNATAFEIMFLWKHYFHPQLNKDSNGMGFKQYRYWSKSMNKNFAIAEKNPLIKWDSTWTDNLFL